MTADIEKLPTRLEATEARIAQACQAARRPRDSVRLVAVSKRKPVELIREAYRLGQRDFGENYAQELRDKSTELADLDELRWHFIGPLQRNKVRYIVGKVALIHTVADERLIEALEKRAFQLGVTQGILLQLNLSGEQSKSGIDDDSLAGLLKRVRDCEHLVCRGLMTMPPAVEQAADVAPFFARLRELAAHHFAGHPAELSMGMSHDFEVAIAHGATIVRVGSSIFGARV
jgi:pyridoxal phosphate enzyme (YggS family)